MKNKFIDQLKNAMSRKRITNQWSSFFSTIFIYLSASNMIRTKKNSIHSEKIQSLDKHNIA